VLQGGLQRIFDLLNIKEDGIWDTDALTHKRGYALHKIGMLEYRAFELTQANLAVLASQHNPQALIRQSKDKFEAPDLLLPSMQKPVVAQAAMQISNSEGEPDIGQEEDYGEEYDDTRTFTVKDFKEQALRYAKDHFSQSSHAGHTTMVSNGQNMGSASDINNSSNYGNPFNKGGIAH
jgi:hypothetical protein